jgi:hypothetical protein
MSWRAQKTWVAWLLVLSFWLAGDFAAAAADFGLRAQLLWGTDDQKPKEAAYKEVDPKLKNKLCRVFKWKNYFEINDQRIALSPKDSKKLKMSSKCELDLRFLDESTLEIKLIGEGKWTKTVRQSVKALSQGELAVLAGDDKDKYDDAWFVVISSSVQ